MEGQNKPAIDAKTALLPVQEKRLAQWSTLRREAIKRNWMGKSGLRAAINLMCLECVGESVDAITNCADRCCPLWLNRPFQNKGAA